MSGIDSESPMLILGHPDRVCYLLDMYSLLKFEKKSKDIREILSSLFGNDQILKIFINTVQVIEKIKKYPGLDGIVFKNTLDLGTYLSEDVKRSSFSVCETLSRKFLGRSIPVHDNIDESACSLVAAQYLVYEVVSNKRTES
jgi:hypothetical protein